MLAAMPESHRFVRGMVAWIGGRQVPLLYDRDPRFAGETKYPLRRMVRFATDALTGFSRRPLMLATHAGVAAGAVGRLKGTAPRRRRSRQKGASHQPWTRLVHVAPSAPGLRGRRSAGRLGARRAG